MRDVGSLGPSRDRNVSLWNVSVIAIVALTVAAAYLASYWSEFDINVFEFVGLTDFGKLAIYPLIAAFAVLPIGLLLAQLNVERQEIERTMIDRWHARTADFPAKPITVAIGGLLAVVFSYVLPHPFGWLMAYVFGSGNDLFGEPSLRRGSGSESRRSDNHRDACLVATVRSCYW
jgi:hypothetical protein